MAGAVAVAVNPPGVKSTPACGAPVPAQTVAKANGHRLPALAAVVSFLEAKLDPDAHPANTDGATVSETGEVAKKNVVARPDFWLAQPVDHGGVNFFGCGRPEELGSPMEPQAAGTSQTAVGKVQGQCPRRGNYFDRLLVESYRPLAKGHSSGME